MRKETRGDTTGQASSRTLTDRVRARVEAKSIDRVYCEMRSLYRNHRRRTKRPAVPELRQAVRAYKQGPSLTKLVAVASFLEDRSLLDW